MFSIHFHLGVWLLAWLLSPLLTFPLPPPTFPPGHLNLLSPTSFLYFTLWISLAFLGCGEHLGNWLLAILVSPILTPPLLLLVTSISRLPLLFCMKLCEPLWVALTVKNLFTINLDVLSSLLYGWKSLEAIIREGLNVRARRLNSKILEHQRTPDSWEY